MAPIESLPKIARRTSRWWTAPLRHERHFGTTPCDSNKFGATRDGRARWSGSN